MKNRKSGRRLKLPRAPLPRQTEKVVPARRGGRYDRNQFRRETKAELDSARRAVQEGY